MTSPLPNGEPLSPGHCHRCGADGPTVARPCGARACRSDVCIDLCVECVGLAAYPNAPWFVERMLTPNPILQGWRTESFPDMNGPAIDLNGARVSQETMTAVRTVLQNAPLRQNSIIQRILEGDRHRTSGWSYGDTQLVLDDTGEVRLEQHAYGDGDGSDPVLEQGRPTAAIIDEARSILDQSTEMLDTDLVYFAPGLPVQPDRPDHYRVRGGECACGFRSLWTQDMDRHIAGEMVPDIEGVPKQWRLCECGASRLCRQVAVADPPPINRSNEPFDPTRGPTIRRIYLCDTCCWRRGIH